MEYILFVILGLLGSTLSAVFGFGTSIIVIGLGAHILPVKEAVALASVLFTGSTITKSFLFSKEIDWKMVALVAVSSVPFVYLGAEMLAVAPAQVAKTLLGVMILLYLAVDIWGKLPAFTVGTPILIGGSALYGFTSGFLGAGNLVKVVLFRELGIRKEAFVGAMAATAVLGNVTKLGSYISTGLLPMGLLYPAIALAVCGVASGFFGRRVLKRMPDKIFERGVQIVLGIAALALLI